MKEKVVLGLLIILSVLSADIVTKRWALVALSQGGTEYAAGGLVPMTLAFNQGMAFSVKVPSAARWLVVAASIFVVLVLAALYRNTLPGDRVRLSSLALVSAGALGNLLDRVRWDRGVVDFIGPFDLGTFHWPIFNIADIAITLGAVALAFSLWRSESSMDLDLEPVAEGGEADANLT